MRFDEVAAFGFALLHDAFVALLLRVGTRATRLQGGSICCRSLGGNFSGRHICHLDYD